MNAERALKLIRMVTNIAIILALFVVMLGAYTRLTDAGLGCPDWPGCYGKMVLPSATDAARVDAQAVYPEIPIESKKAWTEMAHRYAAGTLGLLILGIAGTAAFGSARVRTRRFFPVLLIGLLLFQAALGMWTVTLQLLPVVVMGHLLGGMTLAAFLVWFRWHLSDAAPLGLARWRFWASLGLLIVAFQIALGGWVSANYAGLACIGFPTCNRHWLPPFDWARAFDVLSPVGANYQGGVLDLAARVTIQWVHRLWALVTFVYVLGLAGSMLRTLKHPALCGLLLLAAGLVILQCVLGILNVVYLLPLPVAVLHNGVALMLLLCMVSIVFCVSRRAT